MNRWLRRLLYFVLLILWLVVMSFPALAFFLATQSEVRLGSAERNHVRLFLIQEEENQGVSLEWSRSSGGTAGCRQSNVYFFLWQGAGENVVYCQCLDPESGDVVSIEQGRCGAP